MYDEKNMRNDARFQAKRKGLGKAVLLARLFSKVAVSLSRLVTIAFYYRFQRLGVS